FFFGRTFMVRKRFALVSGVCVLAISAVFFAARSQAQKPGSSVIELCPPISASANVTGVAPVPLGTQIRVGARLVSVLKITSASGAGTLDVYFQHSADDGQTWSDFAEVHSAAAAGTYYIPIS